MSFTVTENYEYIISSTPWYVPEIKYRGRNEGGRNRSFVERIGTGTSGELSSGWAKITL